MDRFPSDLHEKIEPDHVVSNPFFDLSPRMVKESIQEPLHRRMARNPFTGFIQHSVCSTTSQIKRGMPIVIQPSRGLSVGFAGTAPLLRRASLRASENGENSSTETTPCNFQRRAGRPALKCPEPAMAPCFAPLHLTWSEMKEQANFSEEMWR